MAFRHRGYSYSVVGSGQIDVWKWTVFPVPSDGGQRLSREFRGSYGGAKHAACKAIDQILDGLSQFNENMTATPL